MRIAILSPRKYDEAETFIQNHIKHLPFDIVVIYGSMFPYISEKHQASNKKRQLHSLLKKTGFTRQSFKEAQLTKILKEEKIDIVFAEFLITGAETVAVCEKMNIPMVAIALGYEISTKSVIESYKQCYRKLFNYAKYILIVSEHMRTNILSLGCPNKKIIYSPIGPSKSFFKIKPTFKNKQILTVGRFVDKKAPHLSILSFKKVLQEIPDATLVMAGDGPLLDVCKDLVKANNIENSVFFLGKINVEQHISLLQESVMFIQHSKVTSTGNSEGTPVAILEASAAGLPVVSTLHAGIPNVIVNNETGFLVPEDNIELMANKMIKLLKNKEMAVLMGEKGKAYIKDNFSLEMHINIVENYIKKIN